MVIGNLAELVEAQLPGSVQADMEFGGSGGSNNGNGGSNNGNGGNENCDNRGGSTKLQQQQRLKVNNSVLNFFSFFVRIIRICSRFLLLEWYP